MTTFLNYLKVIKKRNGLRYALNIVKHVLVFAELQKQLRSKKQPLDLQLPWITIEAKNMILQYLIKNKIKTLQVFEYGAGGSSLFFLKHKCEVYTIEHNDEWLKKTTIEVEAFDLLSMWHPKLFEPESFKADNNLSVDNPDDYFSLDPNFTKHTFVGYASAIDRHADNFFDIVMIDGRARPSCIKHASRKVKQGGLLIIDNSERLYYYTNTQQYLIGYIKILSSYSALVASILPTQTNIYLKK